MTDRERKVISALAGWFRWWGATWYLRFCHNFLITLPILIMPFVVNRISFTDLPPITTLGMLGILVGNSLLFALIHPLLTYNPRA